MKRIIDWTPDLLMVAGAGAVAYGAGLVYLPAGFIVGGLLVGMAGWLMARSGR
jgi:hypothetical protein